MFQQTPRRERRLRIAATIGPVVALLVAAGVTCSSASVAAGARTATSPPRLGVRLVSAVAVLPVAGDAPLGFDNPFADAFRSTGVLTAGHADVLRFAGRAGMGLDLVVEAPADSRITVLPPSGVPFDGSTTAQVEPAGPAPSGDHWVWRYRWTLGEHGEYRIVVGNPVAGGDYTVHGTLHGWSMYHTAVRVEFDPGAGTPPIRSLVIDGTAGQPGTWVFHAPAGWQLTGTVTGADAELYDPTLLRIAAGQAGTDGVAHLDTLLALDGDHYLRVGPHLDSGGGTYQVRLQLVQAPPAAVETTPPAEPGAGQPQPEPPEPELQPPPESDGGRISPADLQIAQIVPGMTLPETPFVLRVTDLTTAAPTHIETTTTVPPTHIETTTTAPAAEGDGDEQLLREIRDLAPSGSPGSSGGSPSSDGSNGDADEPPLVQASSPWRTEWIELDDGDYGAFTIAGTLSEGVADLWLVDARPGMWLSLRGDAGQLVAGNPQVELRSPRGVRMPLDSSRLESDSRVSVGLLPWTFEESGTHTLVVSGAGGVDYSISGRVHPADDSGSDSAPQLIPRDLREVPVWLIPERIVVPLEVEWWHPQPGADLVRFDGVLDGAQDSWAFAGSAGQELSIELRGAPVRWELLDSAGAVVAAGDAVGERLQLALPADGAYFLAVDEPVDLGSLDPSGATAYSLVVEAPGIGDAGDVLGALGADTDGAGVGVAIAVGGELPDLTTAERFQMERGTHVGEIAGFVSTIDGMLHQDVWVMGVGAGQTVQVAQVLGDVWWALWDVDGALVGAGIGDGEVPIPADGDYFLSIGARTPASSTNYLLTITIPPLR